MANAYKEPPRCVCGQYTDVSYAFCPYCAAPLRGQEQKEKPVADAAAKQTDLFEI